MTWQPIETAPEHYAEVLLWDGSTLGVGYRTEGAAWRLIYNSHGWEFGHECDYTTVFPTHWMPLPEPPEEE